MSLILPPLSHSLDKSPDHKSGRDIKHRIECEEHKDMPSRPVHLRKDLQGGQEEKAADQIRLQDRRDLEASSFEAMVAAV